MIGRRQALALCCVLLLGCVLVDLLGWAGSSAPLDARFPTIVGSVRLEGKALNVAVCGTLAAVLVQRDNGSLAVEIVDFREPVSPRLESSTVVDSNREAVIDTGIEMTNVHAFVWVDRKSRAGQIYALDVSHPQAPALLEVAAIPLISQPKTVNELSGRAMRFENVVFRAVNGDVEALAYSVSVPIEKPVSSSFAPPPKTIATLGNAQDVFILDDLLFVADGASHGLSMIRLSPRPALLPALGWVSTNTPGSAEAVDVFGGLALIADGVEGLSIIALSPLSETGRQAPLSPGTLLGVVDTPGVAVDVAAVGNLALVADGKEGLQIISLPSDEYVRQARFVEPRVVNVSPDTAGVVAAYAVSFTTSNALRPNTDTVTLTFPSGTAQATVIGASGPLPLASILFSVDDKTSTIIPKVDADGNILAGKSTWNSTSRTLTIAVPAMVNAGQRVTIAFTPTAGITNPPQGTNYILHVSTSQDPIPVPTINTFEIKPAVVPTGPLNNVRVVAVSPDTVGANASCIVAFETSATGWLLIGDLITVTFPPGTAIAGAGWPPGLPCGPVDIQIGGAAPVAAPGSMKMLAAAPRGPSVTVPVPALIGPQTRVVLYFGAGVGITNPARGTNYAVMVKTVADPVDALSDPYAILPAGGPPGRVRNVRVANIAPDVAGAKGATCKLVFETTENGALSGAAGDMIAVTFPAGTKLEEQRVLAQVFVNGRKAGLFVGIEKNIGDITLPPGLNIKAGGRVIVEFRGITNPPRGTNYVVAVSTINDWVDAFSDPYEIKPDIEDLIGQLQAQLQGLIARCDQLVQLLERKVELEEDLEALLRLELQSLKEQLTQIRAVIQKEVDQLRSTVETILQQTERLVYELDLKEAIDEIMEWLETLEFSGVAIPPAERRPVDVVLAIDSSGSMETTDPQGIRKTGAKAFVDQLDPERDQVGLVSWAAKVDFSEDLTSNYAAIKVQIDRVGSDDTTNFDAGLQRALALLQAGRAGSVKAIVFLTDGEPDADGYTPPGSSGSWVDKARDAGIRIYAIGFGAPYENPVVRQRLERMAEATGGKAFHGKNADDLVAIYQEIARELANPWIINLKATYGD